MGTDNLIPTSGKYQKDGHGDAQWADLKATAYERTITSQASFISFLQRLYVSPSSILTPPETGWPQITKDSFAALDKSDEVIEVLRNMTYIKGSFDSDVHEILGETVLFNWIEEGLVEKLKAGDAEDVIFATEPDEEVPRDVVGLTIGGRGGSTILLDCRNGIVRWPGCPDGKTSFGSATRGDPAREGKVYVLWGGETAWPVEEFFEYMEAKFVNMEQLVLDGGRVIEKDFITEKPVHDFDSYEEVYQRHGWPGENYDKDACMAEIKELHDKCREQLHII